jgi:hypothetical protein
VKPKKEAKSRLDLAGAELSALDLRGFFCSLFKNKSSEGLKHLTASCCSNYVFYYSKFD